MPMPRASRTIPLRGSADLLAVWSDDVPERAEVVEGLSVGLPGIVIGDDVIKRMPAVSDLDRAVGPGRGAEQRPADAATGFGCPVREQRRPVDGALPVAGRAHALVSLEQIERASASVDADRAHLGA